MAHELEIKDGQAQMAYTKSGGVPWHGLGVPVDDNLSAQEMMKVAGLDWKVRESETFADFDGELVPTGMKALVRESDKKVLTQVGKNWNPVQNEEAFEFFKEFVDEGHMQMETAGALKGGRLVWALAKINESFEAVKGDEVENYLLFTNPHIYGRVVDIRMSATRVVCNNTLTMALGSKSQSAVKLNHSRKFDPDMVKQMMGLATVNLDRYKEQAEFLVSKKTTDDIVKQYFGNLLGRKEDGELTRTAEQALEFIHTQPGAKYGEGSFWQMFNTITYMTNHELGRSNDTRMESTWYGNNAKLNKAALTEALEMAKVA